MVAITDGDTLTILDAELTQHKLRIAGIDAPEGNQPFGQASRKHLSDLTFTRHVEADCYKKHRERRVCNVFLEGKDLGLEQISAGLAWHYKRFELEQSAEARSAYAQAENAARSAKRGLWRDPDLVPPWDWRKRKPSTAQ